MEALLSGLLARYRFLLCGVAGHGGGVVALDAPFDAAQRGGGLGVAFGALAGAVASEEGDDAEGNEQEKSVHLRLTFWLVAKRSSALPTERISTPQP